MSESNPQAEGAPPPEPAVPATEAPAPAAEGAATETTDETKEPEPKPSRTDRRIAALSARLSAGEQERQRLAQEVEHYRRQMAPQQAEPTLTPEQQAAVDRVVEAKLAQRVEAERSESFHTAGRAAYPDWSERCSSLMQMGFDAPLAQLLLEMPDGAKIAGSLADDPEAAESIAGLKTPTARALALGKYGATLADKPAVSRTTRAPAPIRPINGASTRTEFNEHTATPAQLVEFYSRQAMAKRGL